VITTFQTNKIKTGITKSRLYSYYCYFVWTRCCIMLCVYHTLCSVSIIPV